KTSQFRIVAGVDTKASQRDLFASTMPEAATLESISDLPQDLDFVDICTPPHTHFELITYALQHDWNVLCEKPLVVSSGQFEMIRELSIEKQRVVFTVHNWKFAPLCRQVAELLRSNMLGRLHHCSWNVFRNGPSITAEPGNWRLDPDKSGGGILVDHGWHAFYLVMDWFGLQPGAVQASLENRQFLELDVEDTAVINLQFQSVSGHGPSADIFLTWASSSRSNTGVLDGSLASLFIEDHRLRLVHKDGSEEEFQFDARLSTGSHHPDWFEFVAEEFAEELANVSSRGANLRLAHQCLRLIEQSKAASRTKEFLPV
ncbi:MAG TPA: Gfo/Idh/MocA family oxidoreductase, partial [Terrimicrobiaceae bacterium]